MRPSPRWMISSLCCVALTASVRAGDPTTAPGTAPTAASTIAPSEAPSTSAQTPTGLLKQISAESQALFESVRPGLVGVTLPPPRWVSAMLDQNDPMKKWEAQLNPQIREKIQEQQASGVRNVGVAISPTSQPTNVRFRVIQRPDGGFDVVPDGVGDGETKVMRSVGLVVDDEGHIVVPLYVEKEAVGDKPVPVFISSGETVAARFVGSDRQTNLTLLQFEKPAGKPVTFASHRPANGSLVMTISNSGEAGQLLVWTGGLQEPSVVVDADGAVTGLTRYGQFLASNQLKFIVDQLARNGVVRRAELGVVIRQTETSDGKPAIRVDTVKNNSAAEKGGLHRDDLIMAVSGNSISDLPSFAVAIAASDGPTELQIVREGAPMKITVDLKPK